MTIPPSRAELAELFRADDRVQAEHRQFMAQPEAQARALMQRNGDGGALVRKTIEDATPAPAEPEYDWSGWERWMSGHLDNFRDELFDAIAEFAVRMFDRERVAFERKLAELERKLAELKAENIEVKGLLADALKRFDSIDGENNVAQFAQPQGSDCR
jgi:hypothetical protein